MAIPLRSGFTRGHEGDPRNNLSDSPACQRIFNLGNFDGIAWLCHLSDQNNLDGSSNSCPTGIGHVFWGVFLSLTFAILPPPLHLKDDMREPHNGPIKWRTVCVRCAQTVLNSENPETCPTGIRHTFWGSFLAIDIRHSISIIASRIQNEKREPRSSSH